MPHNGHPCTMMMQGSRATTASHRGVDRARCPRHGLIGKQEAATAHDRGHSAQEWNDSCFMHGAARRSRTTHAKASSLRFMPVLHANSPRSIRWNTRTTL
ncbi:hypothetical protein Csal_2350 [Chromohalobacter israelensis DSM 3043]|uniref:Uncharacterized protein n=1 Tax=Chromohalobacter israelensis (strain ATCC BAA-138 / DSM 3043 / CIP 106854 / NCIMB 13768 / 1H11) TaxID=290398 RepID=Q1QV09_CHRI1|nr:hypothetical protein Csal_2350 [Chromohalobacter salexigens DSM 3043]